MNVSPNLVLLFVAVCNATLFVDDGDQITEIYQTGPITSESILSGLQGSFSNISFKEADLDEMSRMEKSFLELLNDNQIKSLQERIDFLKNEANEDEKQTLDKLNQQILTIENENYVDANEASINQVNSSESLENMKSKSTTDSTAVDEVICEGGVCRLEDKTSEDSEPSLNETFDTIANQEPRLNLKIYEDIEKIAKNDVQIEFENDVVQDDDIKEYLCDSESFNFFSSSECENSSLSSSSSGYYYVKESLKASKQRPTQSNKRNLSKRKRLNHLKRKSSFSKHKEGKETWYSFK